MALQVTTYQRRFIYKKGGDSILLPDPNTSEHPDKVPNFYVGQYPELINARVSGPELNEEDNTAVYTIDTKAGTNG